MFLGQKLMLLYGVPGTGKSLLASSIAKDLGLNLIKVSSGQILDR
jgi:SpoVK/Ycf46/Vps4 family AAA+-type ATPase